LPKKKISLQIELAESSNYEETIKNINLNQRQRFTQFSGTQYISNPIKQYAKMSSLRQKHLSPKLDQLK
jgi:hypothetical protein